MENLLLEIGTEEIPAGYIQPALTALSEKLIQRLDDTRIVHGDAVTYGTPRRLAIMVNDVADQQQTVTETQTGPPEKVAYDAEGNPTMAAKKFAEKLGVDVSDLTITKTSKGRYVAASTVQKGLPTENLLKDILSEVILSIPFPKTMRWADFKIAFARPIQTVLALLGTKVIEFTLDGALDSNRNICGHRFMCPEQTIAIEHADKYLDTLRSNHVLADIDERKQVVRKEIAKAARKLGGEILPDEELVDIVTNLVEIPFASAGRFDDDFLELPQEILITAMREHQKYFAVIDPDSKALLPAFIAVNNTQPKDMQLVTTGHERVLRARLSDAKFFYQSDINTKMDDWVDKLKGVLFQAQLGSMHAKMERVRKLVGFLAETIDADLIPTVDRAAYLCKADLVSQAVGEFAKLQGIMGRVYATVANEPLAVANAIEEHYRPVYSGAVLPKTPAGALLAVADKMDSICGCFSVGLLPTGASDPYALRRQSIGILQIIQSKGWTLNLSRVIEKSLSLFDIADQAAVPDIAGQVKAFFINRISYILAEQGYSKDVIAAVVHAGADNIIDVHLKVAALEALKGKPDFEPLAAAFKRVVNIIKKADKDELKTIVLNPADFVHPSESDLLKAYETVHGSVEQLMEKGDLNGALAEIASLRSNVDSFFDGVLVMDSDHKIRRNRLALLDTVAGLFEKIADFSKIST
ncbi:MAG: glycine--tRNA ligase subunit beta [Desulfobacteraceae bacterium]|jgi:glycyl-tRNA synthetase beta chain